MYQPVCQVYCSGEHRIRLVITYPT